MARTFLRFIRLTSHENRVIKSTILGAAIRAARTQAGLRQIDAALSIGVALQTLVDIEAGQAGVSIGKILQVARGLGVTLFVLPQSQREKFGCLRWDNSSGLFMRPGEP